MREGPARPPPPGTAPAGEPRPCAGPGAAPSASLRAPGVGLRGWRGAAPEGPGLGGLGPRVAPNVSVRGGRERSCGRGAQGAGGWEGAVRGPGVPSPAPAVNLCDLG